MPQDTTNAPTGASMTVSEEDRRKLDRLRKVLDGTERRAEKERDKPDEERSDKYMRKLYGDARALKWAVKRIEAMGQTAAPAPAWVPFYFDGNSAWGLIDSPEEWARIVAAYADRGALLMGARRGPNRPSEDGPIPYYGLRSECTGPETLGEHFMRMLGVPS